MHYRVKECAPNGRIESGMTLSLRSSGQTFTIRASGGDVAQKTETLDRAYRAVSGFSREFAANLAAPVGRPQCTVRQTSPEHDGAGDGYVTLEFSSASGCDRALFQQMVRYLTEQLEHIAPVSAHTR